MLGLYWGPYFWINMFSPLNTYSPPSVDRISHWEFYNKILIYPIFYLLKGDYNMGFVKPFGGFIQPLHNLCLLNPERFWDFGYLYDHCSDDPKVCNLKAMLIGTYSKHVQIEASNNSRPLRSLRESLEASYDKFRA